MDRNNLAASLAFCAVLLLNGCGGADVASGSGGNTSNTKRQTEAAANTAPAASDAAPAAAATAQPTNPDGNTASATAAAGAGRGGDKAKSADVPRPQIGSGGNDFFLFTQARAALGADAELKGLSPIIEVKDGVVTLSGTVATPAQRSRAEEVARGVGGVKAVKNQLRVSAGK